LGDAIVDVELTITSGPADVTRAPVAVDCVMTLTVVTTWSFQTVIDVRGTLSACVAWVTHTVMPRYLVNTKTVLMTGI